MFLRANKRFKDGKEHRYWSVVENRRVAGGRSVQKTLLYLGEIDDTDERIEAHVLIRFLAYCLHVTLEQYNKKAATGLSSRSVLERMSEIQMLDVTIPATDARELLTAEVGLNVGSIPAGGNAS